MGKAFSNFRRNEQGKINAIWQEIDTLYPFKCDICRRDFQHGGKRYIASSMTFHSHRAVACQCPDCHAGIDPFRIKTPKLSDRRTSLD